LSRFISRASTRTCRNSVFTSLVKRRQNVASVSWPGCACTTTTLPRR
jgi:hypothetical protein